MIYSLVQLIRNRQKIVPETQPSQSWTIFIVNTPGQQRLGKPHALFTTNQHQTLSMESDRMHHDVYSGIPKGTCLDEATPNSDKFNPYSLSVCQAMGHQPGKFQ